MIPPAISPRDLGSSPALRLSPHAFNNQYDLDRALNLLAELTR
jgi:selenocysteine lyase/cysteine desulfurase